MKINNDRKTDAAIGLLGLGKIYPHTFTDNKATCKLCGSINNHIDMICYGSVPHYGSDTDDSSKLLAILMKVAPYGIEVVYNNETRKYSFIYKGREFKEDKIFKSSTAAEGIRQVAIYHYKIDINQITDKAFNLQV